MYAFDVVKYPDDSMAPIQSYSGKAQVFKRYKDAFNTSFYKSLTKELPVLVNLYDLIEKELSSKYSDYKKRAGVAIPRFGSVKGVEKLRMELRQTIFEIRLIILFQVAIFILSMERFARY